MQHEQPPHASVAVLKWVDALKAHMPVQNLFQRGKAVGGVEQGGHVFGDVAGVLVSCMATSLGTRL